MLLYRYKEVLDKDIPWMQDLARPATRHRIPTVLTVAETQRLLLCMNGVTGLFALLLYGTGLRLMEGLRRRVKDVCFERNVIIVREGKGAKDRVVMLPQAVIPALRAQLQYCRSLT